MSVRCATRCGTKRSTATARRAARASAAAPDAAQFRAPALPASIRSTSSRQPAVLAEYVDAFGNAVTRVELDRPHRALEVVDEMEVRVEPRPELDLAAGREWERVRDQLCYTARGRRAPNGSKRCAFAASRPTCASSAQFSDFAAECLFPGASVPTVCRSADGQVAARNHIRTGSHRDRARRCWRCSTNRSGVCQDFAHLMIACLRSVGLSARYVSGYLRTHGSTASSGAADGADARVERVRAEAGEREADGDDDADGDGDAAGAAPRLRGADASHAWVAVFAPPFGWLGLIRPTTCA